MTFESLLPYFWSYLGIKKNLPRFKFKLLAPAVIYTFNHRIIKTGQDRITEGQPFSVRINSNKTILDRYLLKMYLKTSGYVNSSAM